MSASMVSWNVGVVDVGGITASNPTCFDARRASRTVLVAEHRGQICGYSPSLALQAVRLSRTRTRAIETFQLFRAATVWSLRSLRVVLCVSG
mmetsp:Transcript_76066/g.150740  ORF Transcript_76066/g.150740 Transcript_76066/m.150740 type:complete len:92 (+) Transcript_76066:760-1035(+)